MAKAKGKISGVCFFPAFVAAELCKRIREAAQKLKSELSNISKAEWGDGMEKKGVGIVCEYNPFHSGHKYQIQKAKELGAPFVVCAMSGDFVQRGEPASQDKMVRAKNAISSGADIVLEIPFPFSCLGAEGFCSAGVDILALSGLCSDIVFGSECGDAELLKKTAEHMDESFLHRVKEFQKTDKSLSYARARSVLTEKELGKKYAELLEKPNDILGVEYIKAILSLDEDIRLGFIPVKRTTPRGSHDETFASSSFIRKSIEQQRPMEEYRKFLPENYDFDRFYGGFEDFYKALCATIMLKTDRQLSEIAEIPKGVEFSVLKSAQKASDYNEFFEMLKTKTLTDAKIRRMLLFAFLGVTKEMAKERVAYTRVLAISETGGKMLKKYRDDRRIPLAVRLGDVKDNPVAQRQLDYSLLCGRVLEKCRKYVSLI